jgi:XTP/dITP diphosphohydrolase
MTQSIIFATTNIGKATALRALTAPYGIDVVQVNVEWIEPQADSVLEVAASKAAQAVKLLGKPVVVEDSGFAIDSLNGFPGAYTKYVMATIGAEGLLRLAAPFQIATCYFASAMYYTSPDGTERSFIDHSATGTLATHVDENDSLDAWAELWHIFIPTGYDKPLSSFTTDERKALMQVWQGSSVYGQFVRWLVSETKRSLV